MGFCFRILPVMARNGFGNGPEWSKYRPFPSLSFPVLRLFKGLRRIGPKIFFFDPPVRLKPRQPPAPNRSAPFAPHASAALGGFDEVRTYHEQRGLQRQFRFLCASLSLGQSVLCGAAEEDISERRRRRARFRARRHAGFGMSSPRFTAGRARPRSSQAEVCLKSSNPTSSPA